MLFTSFWVPLTLLNKSGAVDCSGQMTRHDRPAAGQAGREGWAGSHKAGPDRLHIAALISMCMAYLHAAQMHASMSHMSKPSKYGLTGTGLAGNTETTRRARRDAGWRAGAPKLAVAGGV